MVLMGVFDTYLILKNELFYELHWMRIMRI